MFTADLNLIPTSLKHLLPPESKPDSGMLLPEGVSQEDVTVGPGSWLSLLTYSTAIVLASLYHMLDVRVPLFTAV